MVVLHQGWNGVQDGFVTKSRFNEVNNELKTTKDTLKERDEQLETLSKSKDDVEGLQKTIKQLQDDNKKKDEDHEMELHSMKVSNAVDKALLSAKAKNNKAVRALLDLADAKLDDDGNIKGLEDQIKKLQEADDSKMLFETPKTETKPAIKGFQAGEGNDGQPNKATAATLGDAIAKHYQSQS